jgi:hypothetical protein
MIGENADPNFATSFHFTYDRAARSFNLPGGNPTGFHGLQAIFPEGDFRAAGGLAGHSTALLLAPLYTFWH